MRKIRTKQRSFMQQYRAWGRMKGTLRPTLDKRVIDRFGLKMAYLFEQYDTVRHRIRGCDVITRVNFRVRAVDVVRCEDWQRENLRLTKEWRSWARFSER